MPSFSEKSFLELDEVTLRESTTTELPEALLEAVETSPLSKLEQFFAELEAYEQQIESLLPLVSEADAIQKKVDQFWWHPSREKLLTLLQIATVCRVLAERDRTADTTPEEFKIDTGIGIEKRGKEIMTMLLTRHSALPKDLLEIVLEYSQIGMGSKDPYLTEKLQFVFSRS